MLRELLDRFAYRYRRWSAESRSDALGAGTKPPEISPRNEPAWRMIVRLLWVIAGGLILPGTLYRVAMRTFPSLSDGIPMIFIFLAIIWCGVGLFLIGGELLTKYSKSDDDDKGHLTKR
jgi:TRAP-type C4-dicarboxylate transport system permease small subunit